jgi:hypothetical protein
MLSVVVAMIASRSVRELEQMERGERESDVKTLGTQLERNISDQTSGQTCLQLPAQGLASHGACPRRR